MSLKQGNTYRDKDTSLVGVATEVKASVPQDGVRGPSGFVAMPAQDMACLSLSAELNEPGAHVDLLNGHHLRWYPESRLEEVTDVEA